MSIWHTELNDFEEEQGFCCLFFTKSEPKTLCLGYYNPCTQMFGNYMSHERYLPNEIDKFANVENLIHVEAELEKTRKALDVAKKWLMKIGYLNMSDHGLGSEKMMTDWCKTVALHGLKEIETALEQKDVK